VQSPKCEGEGGSGRPTNEWPHTRRIVFPGIERARRRLRQPRRIAHGGEVGGGAGFGAGRVRRIRSWEELAAAVLEDVGRSGCHLIGCSFLGATASAFFKCARRSHADLTPIPRKA